ncbi:MAG: 50S ribosomal protein L25/general stress protein Ctc [Xenococcaceae cyanobacterium MO_207.B15]|nr:50S ribosomal protein L25/general stress protein Ctc [Xenococcaceae cyanobacterium MO_207.B15]MDJ0744234.1 50S ribosomal protein L25/general stress protein Ctc [Xenococcaceae cyanobacterium MO_167.B27]
MNITVECKTRPEGSKPRALRREGLIPAALYGHNGAESVSLIMDAKEAQILLKKAAINNTLVDLNIPDLPWKGKALIREVQAHPWKRNIHHLSFFSVSGDRKVGLVVPIEIVGESAGVKLGGIFEQSLTELNISCSGDNIPESIKIDVSNFEIGTNLSVGQVIFPEGVTALDDAEQTVFSISAPAKMTDTATEGGEALA